MSLVLSSSAKLNQDKEPVLETTFIHDPVKNPRMTQKLSRNDKWLAVGTPYCGCMMPSLIFKRKFCEQSNQWWRLYNRLQKFGKLNLTISLFPKMSLDYTGLTPSPWQMMNVEDRIVSDTRCFCTGLPPRPLLTDCFSLVSRVSGLFTWCH